MSQFSKANTTPTGSSEPARKKLKSTKNVTAMPTPTSRSQSPDSLTTLGNHRHLSSVVRLGILGGVRTEHGPASSANDERFNKTPPDHSPLPSPAQTTISMLTAHFDSKFAALEFDFDTKLAELQTSFDAKLADANAKIHRLKMQLAAQNMGIYDDMGVLRRDVESRMRKEMEVIGDGISENVGNVRRRVGRVEWEAGRLKDIMERVVEGLVEMRAAEEEESELEGQSGTDSESSSDGEVR
ncbi:hypothetical protein BU16DRAFT_590151 [Lophium mytilinum]|uniref:Uncharacterized protein n=1 Tax=Lophium mytilinum TaxID=390894 RepID=A0A6A6QRW5_9PEZI|nr:hypothetical protein BU16DRAFT_590151 [Lophium mytilinum]